MALEMFQVLWRASLEAIHANNLMTFCQEKIDQV